MGNALVGGVDADRAHSEDTLAQRDGQLQVPDPVEQDLVGLDVQKARLTEQPVLTQAVAGEGERQAEMTLAVLP